MTDEEFDKMEQQLFDKEKAREYLYSNLEGALTVKGEWTLPKLQFSKSLEALSEDKIEYWDDLGRLGKLDDSPGRIIMEHTQDLILKQASKMPKNEALDILSGPIESTIKELYEALDKHKRFVYIPDILNRLIKLAELIDDLKERDENDEN